MYQPNNGRRLHYATKSEAARLGFRHGVCARRWADVPIDQIKPLEVQGWLDGMAYGNAHWALVVMRRTLDFAVDLDQIPANPFRRKYEMPRKSSEHRRTCIR